MALFSWFNEHKKVSHVVTPLTHHNNESDKLLNKPLKTLWWPTATVNKVNVSSSIQSRKRPVVFNAKPIRFSYNNS